MTDTLKQITQQTAEEGTQKWEAMSDEQKKQTFDALPEEQKKGKTYLEWIKEGYQNQKENWMPWIEDMYLKWFTNDNKASYLTKDTLDKSKITGIEQVDNLQDGVHDTVAGQIGQGGILQPVGDAVSKEGINRAERQGKDSDGTYTGGGTANATDSVVNNARAGGEALSNGAQTVGNTAVSGVKSAGGYVGDLLGGNKAEQ